MAGFAPTGTRSGGGSRTSIAFPSGASNGDLFVLTAGGIAASTGDPRVEWQASITGGQALVAYGYVTDVGTPLAVTVVGRTAADVADTRIVTFNVSSVVGVAMVEDDPPTNTTLTGPTVDAPAGIAAAVRYASGFATTRIVVINEDTWSVAIGSGAGFGVGRVDTWWEPGLMPAPLYRGSGELTMVVTIGVTLTSPYAAPLRVFPRDDALGPQAGRSIPPPTSWQTGRRYGGGAIR